MDTQNNKTNTFISFSQCQQPRLQDHDGDRGLQGGEQWHSAIIGRFGTKATVAQSKTCVVVLFATNTEKVSLFKHNRTCVLTINLAQFGEQLKRLNGENASSWKDRTNIATDLLEGANSIYPDRARSLDPGASRRYTAHSPCYEGQPRETTRTSHSSSGTSATRAKH